VLELFEGVGIATAKVDEAGVERRGDGGGRGIDGTRGVDGEDIAR